MPFEVYPTPVKGKDGRNILFARPAGGRLMRITKEQIDNNVAKYSLLNHGQIKLVFEEFKHWAAEMLAKGYRKRWHEAIGEWMHDGFHKTDRPDASKLLSDKERLEQLMRDTIQRHGGAITVNTFSIYVD